MPRPLPGSPPWEAPKFHRKHIPHRGLGGQGCTGGVLGHFQPFGPFPEGSRGVNGGEGLAAPQGAVVGQEKSEQVSPLPATAHTSQQAMNCHTKGFKTAHFGLVFFFHLLFSTGKVNLWCHQSSPRCESAPKNAAQTLHGHGNEGISWEHCQKTGVPSVLSKPG